MARARLRGALLAMSAVLMITAGCAGPPTAAAESTAPALAPGQARLWFYRPYEPSESLNLARIDVNGRYIGAVANGAAFYRDVTPGPYHIVPESFGRDINQDRNVVVAPGQQLYVKIVSLRAWTDAACRSCARDTFYAWVVPNGVGQQEVARDRGGI
ncbi:MAG: DUF2846 domain-containing protein [Stellaceae bacterium]